MNDRDILNAFSRTLASAWVTDVEAIFKNENGERCSVVYEILEQLNRAGSPFSSRLLDNDKGALSFEIVYILGAFSVNLFTAQMDAPFPFTSVGTMAEWLRQAESALINQIKQYFSGELEKRLEKMKADYSQITDPDVRLYERAHLLGFMKALNIIRRGHLDDV